MMNKDIDKFERLSAFFDGELDSADTRILMEQLKSDPELRDKYNQYSSLSTELMKVHQNNTPKQAGLLAGISDFFQGHFFRYGLTAAAAIFLTLIIVNNPFGQGSEVDSPSGLIAEAVNSDEARKQLLMIDNDLVQHLIHVMMNDDKALSNQVNLNWIPVGYQRNPNNPLEYSNGTNKFSIFIENKQFGINRPIYWFNKGKILYLYPLEDGRMITLYGRVHPAEAENLLRSIKR